jgi:outer membrane murein-binding lipoprotein Lpp
VRHNTSLFVMAVLALSSFSACGSNQESPSTPFSNQEFDLTGSQRQQQNAQQYQQKSDQEFDAAQAEAEKAAEEAKKAPPANTQ